MAVRKLDSIDSMILSALQENARIANVELAEEIHLSPSPCLARVKALERDGFISRYVTLLDPRVVGLRINVFMQVRLQKQIEVMLKAFEVAIDRRPEIMECYVMTGTSDYLLRVVVSDLDVYERFVTEFVARIPGVGNIQSSFALKQVKYKTALPVEGRTVVKNERAGALPSAGTRHRAAPLKGAVTEMRLDSIDWRILAVLQENARIANVELSRAVGLSPSPCLARVKALERKGFISRYVTLLDPSVLGLGVNCFVEVRLEKQIESTLKLFEAAMGARPEIMECYLMSGTSDYLLRVVLADLEACHRFLTDFVAKVPGVGNIQSSFALKQVKYKTALPIPDETPAGH
jgi:Lrp/AsnC family leucine-responsive transcriptional regulator